MRSGDVRLLGWLAGAMVGFAAVVVGLLPGLMVECFRVSL